jgi:hypothetical protein
MKTPSLLLFICFLSFCCTNKKENDKTPVADTIKEDTAAKIKPEKIVNSLAPVDISPMDMSYFPADYPKLKMDKPDMAAPMARVVYSRPHLQGRKLFHDVLKYDEPWRLGANEATEIDFYKDAYIQGKKIKAGRYILYSIPAQDKWTIILNSNIDSWGLHPDASKDIAKFKVPATQTSNSIEYFTMIFLPTTTGTDLLMVWDNVEIKLPISF